MAAFIADQRAVHRVPYAVSCRALSVSQSWFYKWKPGDVSLRRARRRVLAAAVTYVFRRHRGVYGSPRVTADLKDAGWAVSVNTVAALMREQDLVARRRRGRRGLTKACAAARKAPDLLGRDFTAPVRPNVAWVGDLTDIPNDEGVFYLATVEDLHSRRLIGFATSAHHDPAVATAALHMAIAVRGGRVDGVIFHSDQGGEYTAEVFAKACRAAGIRQSMGRTGSALDNAVAESFNSSLEFELLAVNHFSTRLQARRAIAGWIEEYNHIRRHSTNAMLAPVAFEQAHSRTGKRAA